MADLFTLLRQAAKDGSGYVNLPLAERLEAEAKRTKDGWCTACGCGNDAAGYAHLPTCRNA